jgi:molybdenum cofactor synthesis domain-containing protein
VYADESGPQMVRLMRAMSADPDWPLECVEAASALVPDDPGKPALGASMAMICHLNNASLLFLSSAAIARQVTEWADSRCCDLILTSGGTGFGPRDLTPEAIRPLLHREAPAVAQSLINEGLKYTPLAVLSRPVVGTRHNTLICTLPGRYF